MKCIWPGKDVDPENDVGPIGPPPVQPCGPEILIGGGTPQAIARAGRLADDYLVGGTNPEAVEASYQMAVDAIGSRGKTRQAPPRGGLFLCPRPWCCRCGGRIYPALLFVLGPGGRADGPKRGFFH